MSSKILEKVFYKTHLNGKDEYNSRDSFDTLCLKIVRRIMLQTGTIKPGEKSPSKILVSLYNRRMGKKRYQNINILLPKHDHVHVRYSLKNISEPKALLYDDTEAKLQQQLLSCGYDFDTLLKFSVKIVPVKD